jgi:hypothetical protein
MMFEDGGVPPPAIVKRWISLCESRFGPIGKPSKPICSDDEESVSLEDTGPCIAVHCVAGLGRAPVLVAIALIEAGMDKLDAIELIRRKRRGAFNSRQIQYIDSYKRQTAPAKLLKHRFSLLLSRLSNKFTPEVGAN